MAERSNDRSETGRAATKRRRREDPSGWIRLTRNQGTRLLLDVLLEADPTREFSKTDLADAAGLSRDTVRRRLDLLVELGVVETVDDGERTRYRFDPNATVSRAVRYLDRAVTAGRSDGDGDEDGDATARSAAVAKLMDQAEPIAPGSPGAGREPGDLSEQETNLRRYLERARDRDDPGTVVWALAKLGEVAQERDDLERAETYLEECLEIRRELDDDDGVAWTLSKLAEIAQQRGDLQQSEAHLQDCVEVARDLDDAEGLAWALFNLGRIAEERGNLEDAEGYYEESYEVADEDTEASVRSLRALIKLPETDTDANADAGDAVEAETGE